MKKLMILISLVLVAVLCMAVSKAPRRGLVVNKFADRVIVNTHPQQPMELNPWQQPRLNIQMEWTAEVKDDVKVTLSFLLMTKKDGLCPEFAVFESEWRAVGHAEYEKKAMKSGSWEVVYIRINTSVLHELAFSKMPLKVRVCRTEFYLHEYEAMDLRQAFEIWRGWR